MKIWPRYSSVDDQSLNRILVEMDNNNKAHCMIASSEIKSDQLVELLVCIRNGFMLKCAVAQTKMLKSE